MTVEIIIRISIIYFIKCGFFTAIKSSSKNEQYRNKTQERIVMKCNILHTYITICIS